MDSDDATSGGLGWARRRMTAPYAGAVTTVAPARPQQRAVWLLLRVAVAVGIVVGWVLLSQTPVHRSVDDLLTALNNGEVTSVTLTRPDSTLNTYGSFTVEWEGAGRPARASYEHLAPDTVVPPPPSPSPSSPVPPPPPPPLDDSAAILRAVEASPADVKLDVVAYVPPDGGTTWHLHGIGALVALFLVVGGPSPRLVSRWGWVWLVLLVPPAGLVFIVLEPVPLWRREARPVPKRLTGGWALLLALVAGGLLETIPGYADLFG